MSTDCIDHMNNIITQLVDVPEIIALKTVLEVLFIQ